MSLCSFASFSERCKVGIHDKNPSDQSFPVSEASGRPPYAGDFGFVPSLIGEQFYAIPNTSSFHIPTR
jgi:hypothetical protein